jgi:CheY-like chemotaxis protein
MGKHVLLVEDSELVTEALRILIEATGRRVSIAATVAAASQALVSDPPDVVLLDLTLPDGNGLEVARLARTIPNPPAVVTMTGHDGPEIAAQCKAAGCVAVLTKPVPTRKLRDVLNELLGDA